MSRLFNSIHEAEINVLDVMPVAFRDCEIDKYFYSGEVITVISGLTRKENRVVHRVAAKRLSEGGVLNYKDGWFTRL